jgi:hypothetical protein
MSVSLISVIIGRIASATEASPIAVFGLPEKCGKLDAVFGATVISQRLSKTDQRFIGMFHRKMDRAEVKKMLMSAATK